MKIPRLYTLSALFLLALLSGYNKDTYAQALPPVAYPDTSGKQISLKNIQGKKATLIVFWASWCAPCRKEIPSLKALYSKYKEKGVSIVSISVDQNISAWKKAVREEQMPWPNLANLPAAHQPVMELFGINAVPTLLLIDKDGQMLLTDPGLEEVEAKISSLLSGGR